MRDMKQAPSFLQQQEVVPRHRHWWLMATQETGLVMIHVAGWAAILAAIGVLFWLAFFL